MRFKDKVVLVTGAGRGIGRSIALAFGREGAKLAINDLTPVNLDDTETRLLEGGAECLAFTCDVSRKTQFQSMLEGLLDHFGRLDILVNNAGVEPVASILTMDEWDWDRALAVNLKAPFLTMQSAGRIMRDQGGGVILNLGGGELRGEALGQRGAYAASKYGLLALTRAAAIEFALYGIRVNMLSPYSHRGERGVDSPGDSSWQEAVADAALYLCSDDAKFVTGEVISIHDPLEVD